METNWYKKEGEDLHQMAGSPVTLNKSPGTVKVDGIPCVPKQDVLSEKKKFNTK